MAAVYKFKPYNVGRWVIWGLFAFVLLMAPMVFTSNLSTTMLAQMGIAIIACLSYNILLGQGGMLSFGHAVYTGLGSYMAIHALNAVSGGKLNIPVSLLPIVGGVAGMGFAILLGWVTTRKSGTPFAMITLGVAELVFAMSLMFSEFFGGEAGVSGNRVAGQPFFGITYGPQIQVYYLIAAYTFVCVALMYAFTQTPLGRILNAVRDNPERVEFIGYNTQRVRYMAFIISGFFAGIAGGLGSILFEIVTAEVVGAGSDGDRIASLHCRDGREFSADQVILCGGAWSRTLLESVGAGFVLPVRPVKGQMLLYRAAPGLLPCMVMNNGRYLIQRKDGHILCGSTLEETGFEKATTSGAREALMLTAGRLLPALAGQEPVAQWAGLRPGSPNGIPFIGRVPGICNLWVNTGHFRNGLVLAPASARLMADLVLQRAPLLDPAPYQCL